MLFLFTGSPADCTNRFIERIRAAKRYFKGDYKLHAIEESLCAEHCIRYALSSNNDKFASACNHDHQMACDRCKDCREIAKDILTELDSECISYR